MSDPIRLDKCVAALLGCSRGQAQQYIEGGWVAIDGAVVEEPQALAVADQVSVAADAVLAPAEPATLLLHKPAGLSADAAMTLATAVSRSELDPLPTRILKRHFLRLSAPLALDEEASGLLVLSQDGRVLRRLTEDAASIEQEYVVDVRGTLHPYGMARLTQGMVYRQRRLPPCKVSWQSEQRLRFAIKHVQPGQLRAMCGEVGLDVVGIRRLRIGRVSLGRLVSGQWRYLPAGERF